jgi:hypothetical protein
MRKYGLDVFTIEAIASSTSRENLLLLETALILQDGTNRKSIGYNLTAGGEGLFQMIFSPDHRAKIGASNLGRKHGPEARANMSKAQKGKKRSPEAAKKSALSRTGLKHSEATKIKMSTALMGNSRNTGKSFSLEHRQKIAAALIGHPGAGKGIPRSAETRAKIAASLIGIRHSDATREKMRVAALARYRGGQANG